MYACMASPQSPKSKWNIMYNKWLIQDLKRIMSTYLWSSFCKSDLCQTFVWHLLILCSILMDPTCARVCCHQIYVGVNFRAACGHSIKVTPASSVWESSCKGPTVPCCCLLISAPTTPSLLMKTANYSTFKAPTMCQDLCLKVTTQEGSRKTQDTHWTLCAHPKTGSQSLWDIWILQEL